MALEWELFLVLSCVLSLTTACQVQSDCSCGEECFPFLDPQCTSLPCTPQRECGSRDSGGCSSVLCQNRGTCFMTSNGPVCRCTNGYVGETCADYIIFGQSCNYDAQTFAIDAVYNATDGCNVCRCREGGATTCTQNICPDRFESMCMYYGRTYSVGRHIPSVDGCNTCTCTPSTVNNRLPTIRCTRVACPGSGAGCSAHGSVYPHGILIPAGDGCNVCHCFHGQVACSSRWCGSYND